MTSLRRRLFLLLISATAAIWLCAVGWIYFENRAELEHVLDTRLQEARPRAIWPRRWRAFPTAG